jgi:hypothetical protein
MSDRGYDQDVALAADLDAEPSVPLLVERAFRAAPPSQ